MKRLAPTLAVLGGLWLLGLLLAVLNFWPWPSGHEGWFWLLLIGPPAALLLQAAGEWYAAWWQDGPLGRAVRERTADRRFSWLRILVALTGVGLLALVVGGVAMWIA